MTQSIHAAAIATLLDTRATAPRVLSLDCFDTLLWRNVHAPIDVFADLPGAGGGGMRRGHAEALARRARLCRDDRDEVSIEAICTQLLPPSDDPAPIAATVAAELTAEARHCFAFAPVVALIDAARARGIKVVIVSDTYLSSVQLRALIAAAAGQDVADRIDTIFCSSEHGRAKAQGLFEIVLDRLRVPPADILHLGDNPVADRDAPTALGIAAVHFEQFGAPAQQQLRFEAAVARMIEPATGVSVPTMQPHRAALSLHAAADDRTLIGHDVLGPIMLGFARWLKDEADTLAAQTGRRVTPVFLLRDGHLPARVFAAAGLGEAATVEVSRFTARRASFGDADAIRRYLDGEPTEQVAVLGRQLLLDKTEIARIGRTHRMLRKAVLEPSWVATITRRSARFADRLAVHVRARTDARPGDILMVVDLGYQGTVQDLAHAPLSARLGVDIVGRYLLLTQLLSKGLDKKGLLDARHYDNRLLHALVRNVAALEQLSTIGHGSVIDYRFDGAPMRRRVDIAPAQIATREAVQTACLAFVDSHASAKHGAAASDGPETDRRMVAATLVRLLLLPRAQDVAVLGSFDHDVNLGTSELATLAAPDQATIGLRRRGIGYLHGADRMFLAGEMQPHGLPMSLSLLATSCFGIDLRQSDFRTGGIDIPFLIVGAAQELATSATAHPTHDGYYLLAIPVMPRTVSIGIQIGQLAEVVQIESAGVHPLKAFADGKCLDAPIAVDPVFDAMEAIADGLYRCGEHALVFVPPIASDLTGPLVLTLVFRPVVVRTTAARLRDAA